MTSLRETIELIEAFYLDGFIAGFVGLFTAGLVGSRLALHRVSLAALAVPQLSAFGLALTCLGLGAWAGALEGGIGSLLAVALGVLVLGWSARHRSGSASRVAGFLFVTAWAGSRLVASTLALPELNDFLLSEGRLLTVTTEDRNHTLTISAIVLVFYLVLSRRLDACVVDPDFARIAGMKPGLARAAELALAAFFIAMLVPRLGAQAVMAALFLPATAVFPVARSLSRLGLTSALLALAGLIISFLAAVEFDWPLDSCLAVTMAATALAYVLILRLAQFFIRT